MSDSVTPETAAHQAPPSLGFSSGVGCHLLLQCMKVKSESEVAQSCPTLYNPMDISLPRLLQPWDFPGKSTGVGCCCLLCYITSVFVVVVQSLGDVQLFATPQTATHQASLSFTISQSLLKLMFIESVMPSNHLIFCFPLLLLPSIFPSIRVFSSESALHIRWPKYWSFSFSISPSNEYSGLVSFRID